MEAGWLVIGVALAVNFFSSVGLSLLMPLSMALWMEGAVLSVILPMTPYVVWFGVVVAWMIACVEAFFAAPLWAIMHLHPEGNDAVGKGGSGYMLLFSLAFRPVLMIVGLISAFAIMAVAGGLLNKTIASGISMSGFDNSIIGTVAMIFVYVSLLTMVIKTSIGLVHVIPDKILSWIGGHGGDLGQSAGVASNALEEGHKKGAAAVVGAQQMRGNMIQGMQADKQAKEQAAHNKGAPEREAKEKREIASANAAQESAAALKQIAGGGADRETQTPKADTGAPE